MTDWQDNRWMLPEGIEEALPEQAACLEGLRRDMLDLCSTWGYDQIDPPVVEYLDALFSGAGEGLQSQTFKLVDPCNGRLLGIRADMTPQAARIDSHRLHSNGINRLCYVGGVLRTTKGSVGNVRNPIQFGAELFGSDSLDAEFEVASLMLESLSKAGVVGVHLDLGHVGIFREVASNVDWTTAQQARFFGLLQNKDKPEITQFLAESNFDQQSSAMLAALSSLHGDASILGDAEEQLSAAGPAVVDAIDALRTLAQRIEAAYPSVTLNYDLAELHGYAYHTGIVFAAFVEGQGAELARGGRYDSVGEAFGRSRPASGFSIDLRLIARVGDRKVSAKTSIAAPAKSCPELAALVKQLRDSGKRVTTVFDDSESSKYPQSIRKQNNQWVVA
jgi:ATP phosphoribosyltransferase regulatory subunit